MLPISIITVCFNEVSSIQKTIDSVVSQNINNIEWIVVDGGSTDGTLEILEKYRSRFTYIISEKDAGIYNAMNKGIALARGEYLLFLNGGDYLADTNTLSQILSNRLKADFVYGDINIISGSSSKRFVMPSEITPEFLYRKTIPHQSTLTKRSLFDKAGLYNEHYKIVADYEFILRALLRHDATFQYLPIVFACYPNNGVSSDVVKRKAEKSLVHRFYYSPFQRFFLKNKIKSKLRSLFIKLKPMD